MHCYKCGSKISVFSKSKVYDQNHVFCNLSCLHAWNDRRNFIRAKQLEESKQQKLNGMLKK